ncbi:ABC transporter related protein [Cellulomonas flavigena DSM 20109]|uniref:ABC transporter related protein n=1 Tax=Cellulomonas flavigena (strain ATCC 482 / DSM 20109 / BCRC 11376 / JCM 18109 / NBRC 3775 / NCIMB 8073 / NRS 134) TaxID=446466 RepID=D5UCT8_CELFN|nr:ABC transporter ATP-binding protein [Cellulomonas flavigena]ADG76323.1 ABC transporter related protein [Cellulomonas flavigena DSM 20109]
MTTATHATAPAVLVEHVTRRFGPVTALDDVSLQVEHGEIVGLLGPNGAGKTTLLSLLGGLRAPDEGTVRLFGRNPRDPAARTSLGTTPQETGLPQTLKVREVVDFVAGHYTDPMPRAEVLERFGLTDMAEKQTGALSGGQKRRLAVALALVGRPRLVLLDEPTTGLDVEARHVLWDALRTYHADGATVIVTSHYLEEIEALAERVVVVAEGRVLADDRLARVLDLVAARRMTLTVDGTGDDLTALPGVQSVRERHPAPAGTRVTLVASDADTAVRALVGSGTAFRDLEVRGASLEEAFLALTSRGVDPAAGLAPAAPTLVPEVTR